MGDAKRSKKASPRRPAAARRKEKLIPSAGVCLPTDVSYNPSVNKSNKGRSQGPERSTGADVPPMEELISEEELERFSALQMVDLISHKLSLQGASGKDLSLLRRRVEEMEEVQDQARVAVEKLSEAVDKLRAPALRLGTLLQRLPKQRALVCVNGTDYICSVDPQLPEASLETGTRVLLNEAFAVTDSFGFDKNGPVVKIVELLSDGRIRAGNESGISDLVVMRSSLLMKKKLKPGLDLRLDANQRVAVEIIGTSKRLDRALSHVDPIRWDMIGGQKEALQAIRDSIEMPFLHAKLFKRFHHPVPKGFLLYGAPACGQTLLGKATAHNLRLQIKEQTGED